MLSIKYPSVPFLFVVITFLLSVDFHRLTLNKILTCVCMAMIHILSSVPSIVILCLSCICYTLLLQECKNEIKYLSIKYPSDLFSFIMFPLIKQVTDTVWSRNLFNMSRDLLLLLRPSTSSHMVWEWLCVINVRSKCTGRCNFLLGIAACHTSSSAHGSAVGSSARNHHWPTFRPFILVAEQWRGRLPVTPCSW